MKILYLAHRIPYPPNKGDKLRAYHQLAHLAKRHAVWCACFVDDARDLRYVSDLEAICEDVTAVRLSRAAAVARGLAGLATGQTLTESYYRCRALRAALRRWSADIGFDAVVAFSSSMAPYALDVSARRRVLDLCDLDSRKWLDYAERSRPPLRWLYRAEGVRLSQREVDWASAFDATILITQREARPLVRRVPAARVHAVANGVEIPARRDDQPVSPTPASRAATVGFVGVMDYRPNVDAVRWFVLNCWPRIRVACPGATFRIVGRSPTRGVRRLQREPGVTVVGGVDDVAGELDRFDVSVAPLRIARGLQNKVLEAMAWGKPVVLTPAAAEGIQAKDSEAFLIARDASEMVQSVVSLLQDESRRTRIGEAGLRFVRSHHRWNRILRHFELVAVGGAERAISHSTGNCEHPSPASVSDGVPLEVAVR